MRIRNLEFILIFILCISSCRKILDNPVEVLATINCENLQVGIINMDSRIVKSEINKIATHLEPLKTESDGIGHRENIKALVDHLNSQCSNIKAELLCYACIKTLPPQSEILLTTDSAGVAIKRVIDILTPADSSLSCLRIHESYGE